MILNTSLLASLAQTYTPPSYPKYWTPTDLNANAFMSNATVSLLDFTVSPYIYSFSKLNFYYPHVIPLMTFGNVWDYVDFAFLSEIYNYDTDDLHIISQFTSMIVYKAKEILFNETTVTADNFAQHKTFLVDSIVFDLFDIINFFVANKSKQDANYNSSSKYEIADLILPLWATNNPSDTIMDEVLTKAKNKTATETEINAYYELLKSNGLSSFQRLIYSIAADRITLSNQGYNYGFVLHATAYVGQETNPTLKSQYKNALMDYVATLFI